MIVKRKLPVNFEEKDRVIFAHELEKDIHQACLEKFTHILINFRGYFWKSGKVKQASILHSEFKSPYQGFASKLKFFIKNVLFPKKIIVKNEAIWCSNAWSANYFHWLTEAIPKALFILEFKPQENHTLILPIELQNSNFINSSLKLIGISNTQYLKPDEVASCEYFSFSSSFANTGNYDENIINKTRTYLQTQLNKQNISLSADRKIFISRKNADRRKIKNEQEIEAILIAKGFEILHFENLDFMEQAKISYQCKYLISNHGAGLTNMIFMNPASSVFELRHQNDTQNNCYFSLASALNHHYFYQLCDSESDDAHQSDLIIDVNEFKKNIDLMLNFKNS